MELKGRMLAVGIICMIGVVFMFSSVFAQGNYEKAIEAYVKKDYSTAITYLKEYVAEKPDPKAYYLLGYASYKVKNTEDSAKYFKEAYLIDPDFDPKTITFEKK